MVSFLYFLKQIFTQILGEMIHLTNVGEIALIASKSFELPVKNMVANLSHGCQSNIRPYHGNPRFLHFFWITYNPYIGGV